MSFRPRIAVAGFQHETNTFSPFGTDLRDFETAGGWPALARGAEITELFPPLNIPIGGFLRSPEMEYVPIIWANAEAGGAVSNEAFETISDLICSGIAHCGSIDGIYLDLHGAMVTRTYQDGEGELLERIRSVVGPDLPIIISLDLHANVTAKMVELSDAMAIYRTYPHLDMAETGARARQLMLTRLQKQKPICKTFRKLPFLIPMSAQCTDSEPLRTLYRNLESYPSERSLSADIAAGFPAADICECGPAVVAYGVDEASTVQAADQIYHALLEAEDRFANLLLRPNDAVVIAARKGRTGRPVVLADVQDNPGCGASSDTTGILRALVDARVDNVAIGVMWDPEAARTAHSAGIGAEISIQLGGRYGYDSQPFMGRFRVEALSNGQIVGSGIITHGLTMSLGPMAQIRLLDIPGDLRVVVSSRRFQCLDQVLFRALGIEPSEKAILVVKSTIHFRADFDAIAGDVILVEAPGANACRLQTNAYQNLRPGVRLDVGQARQTTGIS